VAGEVAAGLDLGEAGAGEEIANCAALVEAVL
jgi:hypothetical protein